MSEDRERLRKMIEATSVLSAETFRLYNEEFPPVAPPGNTVHVAVGDNVQAALDSIRLTGGVLLLAVGEHRVNLNIESIPNSLPVLITSDTSNIPAEGHRITREHMDGIARLKSANNTSATINYKQGSSHVNLTGIGFLPMQLDRTVMSMGTDNMTSIDQQPHDIVHDRILMLGDPVKGQHRGIMAHAKNYQLLNSSILDFHEQGRDSQALSAWNGGQDITIRNCHLEAGAENVLFGGGACRTEEMAPSRILIEDCLFDKNPAWIDGTPQVKCLFEIKHARGVTIRRNIFEHCWPDAWGSGTAFAIKCADQSHNEPWTLTEDVLIENNIIRKVGMGFSIVGKNDDGAETQLMRNLTIRNNLLHDIDINEWQGKGALMTVSNVPENFILDHLTVIQNKWGLMEFWYNQPEKGQGFTFINSAVWQGAYGIKGPAGTGYDKWAIDMGYAPEVTSLAVRKDPARNPNFGPGNVKIEQPDFDQSFNADWSVKSGSVVANVATNDGELVGCDITKLPKG